MLNHFPATTVSQQNHKAKQSIAGSILCFLLSMTQDTLPQRDRGGALLSAAFAREGTSVRNSLSCRKTTCSSQPKFLSIWPDKKLPSDIRSSLENWDVQITGKEKQVVFSWISHSIKTWVLTVVIWLPDTFQEEPHKRPLHWTSSTTWQSVQDPPTMQRHTRPQILHQETVIRTAWPQTIPICITSSPC